MKKLNILLIVLLAASGTMAQSAQPCSTCLPEGITFTSQAEIDNFQTDYPNCTEIEGDIEISGVDITNLNGLSVLTSIGGYVLIWNNDILASLTGLDNLNSIGNALYINNNQALTSLSGLDNVTSIGDYLGIVYNIELINLNGLDNLTSIGGFLSIWDNIALTSLTGIENLTSIGSYLAIVGNSSLINLTGLDKLTSIGGYIRIEVNPALTNLTGLDNINAMSIWNLYIYDNASLSTCAIQSICDELAAPSGTIEIHDNATGCNSPEEVDSACVYLSNAKVTSEPEFTIFPNPSFNCITIELPNTNTPRHNTILTIYDINGQVVSNRQITEQQTVVNMSGLSQGVYVVKVVSDVGVMVEKVVKQ